MVLSSLLSCSTAFFFLSSRNAPVGLRDDKKKGCETDCVGQWKVVFKKMERLYDLWIAGFVE